MQEFFFDGIESEDLESKSLSIEVCHQSAQKLGKDLEIGEIYVPLKDLTQLHSKKEVRIIEEVGDDGMFVKVFKWLKTTVLRFL